jgi:hypothetical protein
VIPLQKGKGDALLCDNWRGISHLGASRRTRVSDRGQRRGGAIKDEAGERQQRLQRPNDAQCGRCAWLLDCLTGQWHSFAPVTVSHTSGDRQTDQVSAPGSCRMGK